MNTYKTNKEKMGYLAEQLVFEYFGGEQSTDKYDSKKDEDEPTHPVGFHDNVPEEKKDEDPENCDSCTI